MLNIIAVHGLKVNFDAVAERMGPNCSSRAVQEQLKKLRKLVNAPPGATAGTTETAGFSSTTKRAGMGNIGFANRAPKGLPSPVNKKAAKGGNKKSRKGLLGKEVKVEEEIYYTADDEMKEEGKDEGEDDIKMEDPGEWVDSDGPEDGI